MIAVARSCFSAAEKREGVVWKSQRGILDKDFCSWLGKFSDVVMCLEWKILRLYSRKEEDLFVGGLVDIYFN